MVHHLIPAWRKIGLKLKYANDSPNQSSENDVQKLPNVQTEVKLAGGRKKRKLSPELDAPARPIAAKGNDASLGSSTESIALISSKAMDKALIDGNKLEQWSDSGIQANGQETTGEQRNSAFPEIGRKKSVSFAPGTKNEDISGRGEFSDNWKDQAETSEPVELLDELRHTLEQAVGNKASKRKKQKRTKSTLIANQSNDQITPSAPTITYISTESWKSPLVEYIELFHKDRANWKFNKARQNHVFKHIFDIGKIPSLYNEALIAYVGGLQGEAARDQLRERALQIRDQDFKDGLDSETRYFPEGEPKEEMTGEKGADTHDHQNRKSTDEEREKAAYRAGLRRFKEKHKWDLINQEEEDLQLSDKWEQRLRRRARSEAILTTLGTSKRLIQLEDTLNTSQRKRAGIHFDVERTIENKMNINDQVTGTKRKRQRKRRTAMPADDSSSDETSSSEDESDSEKTLKRAKLEAERLEAKAAKLASRRTDLKSSDSEKTNAGDSNTGNTTPSGDENSSSSDSGSTSSSYDSSDNSN